MSKLYEVSESYRRAFQYSLPIPPPAVEVPIPIVDMLSAVEIIDNVVRNPKNKINVVPIIIGLVMLGSIGYWIFIETNKKKTESSLKEERL